MSKCNIIEVTVSPTLCMIFFSPFNNLSQLHIKTKFLDQQKKKKKKNANETWVSDVLL